jgi:hypothetical protein
MRLPVLLFAAIALAWGDVPTRAAPDQPAAQSEDAQSAGDDADFLFRLSLMEGHLMIGHELLRAKRPALALPHFGHPVRELYEDVSDYLTARQFPAFDRQLARLEAAVASAPASPNTERQYQDALVTLRNARALAPVPLRASIPENIRICADLIDAASGEFSESLEAGKVKDLVEYHDSRGYLEYVAQQVQAMLAAEPEPRMQALLTRFREVLAKARWIVEPLTPDPQPRASLEQFRNIAREARDLGQQAR